MHNRYDSMLRIADFVRNYTYQGRIVILHLSSLDCSSYGLFGGSDEDRTRYLLHAMEALSQVSYGPTVRYLLYINSLVRQQEICVFYKKKR